MNAMRQRLIRWLSIVVLVAGPCSRAYAGVEPANRQAYEAGLQAMLDENWHEAHRIFSRLWEEQRGFDIALNLGQSEMQLGRYRDAAEHLDFGLRYLPLGEDPGVRESASAALRAVKRHVATLRLSVDPPGTEVTVNGTVVGTAPLDGPVYAEPGTQTVRGEKPGYEAAQQVLNAIAGEERAATFALTRASTPPPTFEPGRPPEHRESPDYAPAVTVGSLAVAATATGAVLFIVAGSKSRKRQDLLSSLPGDNPCGPGNPNGGICDEIDGLADSAKTLRASGIVSLGGAVIAAVATYLLWPRSKSGAETATRPVPALCFDGGVHHACMSGTF
jgi:hypothetical protein